MALAARSLAHNPSDRALADADEAQTLALAAGDIDTLGATCVCRANALQELHRFDEAAEQYAQGYARALEGGHIAQQQKLAAYGAAALSDVGRYPDARRMLREALCFPSRGMTGLAARAVAVILELYMGDTEAATRHLDRARELAPDLETKPAQHGPTLLAMYHIVTGTPEQAVEVLHDNFAVHAPGELGYADWMLMWAALAMGELAMNARGRPSVHLDLARASLRELLAAREALGGEVFPPTDPIAEAHRLVLHAELGRAFDAPDQADRWRALAHVEDGYGEAWVMTLAMLHCARSLLEARASRTEVAVPLGRAHARSERFGFRLLLRETLDLAQRSRVALDGVPGHERRGVRPGATDGLTAREREVLAHLVAGRTYSQIATALFISPKTVSVHVTHVLQKTGTSSRAEAAAWAWQHGVIEQ
jgi:DNA-binding CsgD family transcriptional regulator/tetratricopeptide (TPR) repeat protein